jgi:hypothetical protein
VGAPDDHASIVVLRDCENATTRSMLRARTLH